MKPDTKKYRIATALFQDPEARTAGELADKTGVKRGTVDSSLSNLQDKGFVVRHGDGGHADPYRYDLSDKGTEEMKTREEEGGLNQLFDDPTLPGDDEDTEEDTEPTESEADAPESPEEDDAEEVPEDAVVDEDDTEDQGALSKDEDEDEDDEVPEDDDVDFDFGNARHLMFSKRMNEFAEEDDPGDGKPLTTPAQIVEALGRDVPGELIRRIDTLEEDAEDAEDDGDDLEEDTEEDAGDTPDTLEEGDTPAHAATNGDVTFTTGSEEAADILLALGAADEPDFDTRRRAAVSVVSSLSDKG